MGIDWRNSVGLPLSGDEWLSVHHNAKRTERLEFAKKIIGNRDVKSVVDLGCGTGLWLDTFVQVLSDATNIYGIDLDKNSLKLAKEKSKHWPNKTQLIHADFESDDFKLPEAEVYLAFNVFGYVSNPKETLRKIKRQLPPNAQLIIRQYDGAALRFGPMDHFSRLSIDASLYAGVGSSRQFYHYAFDRVFSAIIDAKFKAIDTYLDAYYVTSPYSPEQLSYIRNMLDWTSQQISEVDLSKLDSWAQSNLCEQNSNSSYFYETDLVAIVS